MLYFNLQQHTQPALVIIDLYVGFSYFYCRALFLSSPLIFYFIFLFSILITTGRHGTQYPHRYICPISRLPPSLSEKNKTYRRWKKKKRGYIRPITCCSFVFEIYILFEIPYRFLYIRRYSFYSLAGIVAFCITFFVCLFSLWGEREKLMGQGVELFSPGLYTCVIIIIKDLSSYLFVFVSPSFLKFNENILFLLRHETLKN